MRAMKPTLVCFALKEEAGPFRRAAEDRPDVSVLITGIGRRNAEDRLREFLAGNQPSLVLTCGFAGGLNPELSLGAVVFGSDDAALAAKLASAGAKPAKFVCADKIATTAAEKTELRRSTGADVVEMESEAIHAICRERGIPCAIVRVIQTLPTRICH
jgi:adenosylhomocysteine nucleosidase